MHQEPPHGAPRGAHVIHAKKGGAWKWLAGAAVVALLVGGGYYAYTSSSSAPQSNAEIAANAPSSPADALDSDQPGTQEPATAEENLSAPAATETQAAQAAPAHRRPAVHAAAPVPEQVVGVTPVSATTEGDEIVIPGVRHPIWTRTPSAYRLSSLYPERALERGSEGEASVHCTVQESGALNCVQVSETPAHAGFGNAALRVARTFRHAPQLADGSAAAGTPVNLRVIFRMAEERRRG